MDGWPSYKRDWPGFSCSRLDTLKIRHPRPRLGEDEQSAASVETEVWLSCIKLEMLSRILHTLILLH